MAALGAIPQDGLDGFVALGELGLDGRLAHVGGVLTAAIAAQAQGRGIICPAESGPEAAWASEEIDILAANSLLALVNHLTGHQLQARPQPGRKPDIAGEMPDLADVRGQALARRALEVAASGGHNMLMLCPDLRAVVSRPRCNDLNSLTRMTSCVRGRQSTPLRTFVSQLR